ncbi:glycosyltransferase [Candidatus Microgenomates bacterium]|nr:MAG: glycosyltransferase [Candidatus Microgenomates bacterium]
MINKKLIENGKVVIVFHEATTGLAYDLRDYLLKNGVEKLLFISHPLLYLKENFKKTSRYEFYKKGKLIKTHNAFHWALPEMFLYIKDCFYSIFWCLKMGGNFDYYFGIGNLNAFSGYVLKLFGKVDKVIYYVIDYVPERFNNGLVNSIYHRIEKICAEKSNWTWNLSPRMIEGRSKKWGKSFPNQMVVPHGVNFNRIKRLRITEINKNEILYMGTLLEKQGIQLVIQALTIVKKKIPEIKLTIIGKGPYERELKKLVDKLGVQNHVEFLGYIEDHKSVENRIAKAAITIALYDKKRDQFTYYADPGKIKNYLGAGIPVIMTDIPYVAKQVEKAKCGFIISYNKLDLAKLLIKYFTDINLMKTYRQNAVTFAKNYDWDLVFDRGFGELKKTLS